MSVSTRVAAHAHAAVLVVPAGWRRGSYPPGPVTVGVDDPGQALDQVEPALAYARDLGRPLVVLHAAWLAEPYQDLVFGNTTREAWVHDGSTYIAKHPTTSKPDAKSEDWIIAARRGRDGERGQKGADGSPPAPIKLKG